MPSYLFRLLARLWYLLYELLITFRWAYFSFVIFSGLSKCYFAWYMPHSIFLERLSLYDEFDLYCLSHFSLWSYRYARHTPNYDWWRFYFILSALLQFLCLTSNTKSLAPLIFICSFSSWLALSNFIIAICNCCWIKRHHYYLYWKFTVSIIGSLFHFRQALKLPRFIVVLPLISLSYVLWVTRVIVGHILSFETFYMITHAYYYWLFYAEHIHSPSLIASRSCYFKFSVTSVILVISLPFIFH